MGMVVFGVMGWTHQVTAAITAATEYLSIL